MIKRLKARYPDEVDICHTNSERQHGRTYPRKLDADSAKEKRHANRRTA